MFREAREVSEAPRLCSVLEAVSALIKVVVTLGEAMNLKLKMPVLVKLFLALALMSVCPPDWHWENVENYRWLERSWQQDNERVGDERDKDSAVCHVHTMNTSWELTTRKRI